MSEKLAFLVLFSQRAESTAGHHGMLVCCFQPARGREHSERNFVTVTSRRRLNFLPVSDFLFAVNHDTRLASYSAKCAFMTPT